MKNANSFLLACLILLMNVSGQSQSEERPHVRKYFSLNGHKVTSDDNRGNQKFIFDGRMGFKKKDKPVFVTFGGRFGFENYRRFGQKISYANGGFNRNLLREDTRFYEVGLGLERMYAKFNNKHYASLEGRFLLGYHTTKETLQGQFLEGTDLDLVQSEWLTSESARPINQDYLKIGFTGGLKYHFRIYRELFFTPEIVYGFNVYVNGNGDYYDTSTYETTAVDRHQFFEPIAMLRLSIGMYK